MRVRGGMILLQRSTVRSSWMLCLDMLVMGIGVVLLRGARARGGGFGVCALGLHFGGHVGEEVLVWIETREAESNVRHDVGKTVIEISGTGVGVSL